MPHVTLVIPPGQPYTTPNHEGSAGLGAIEDGNDAFRYPPHTAAITAAVLRGAGYDVTIIDAVALGLDIKGGMDRALSGQPDLIGVFVSWATCGADRALLAALRQGAPAIPRVALGVSVRLLHDALSDADYMLEGEPELAFLALCRALLEERRQLARVVSPSSLGVSGYDAEGFLSDLDALPFPAWDLLPTERYRYLSVMGSRGCEGGCRWCPYVVAQGHRFRTASPSRIVAEVHEVVTRYHPTRIVFRDPAFAHDPQRVADICRHILLDSALRPGKTLLWECESRPEHLDRHLLRLMSLSGCMGIKLGLETTDAGVLTQEGRVDEANEVAGYLAHVASLARDCAHFGIACRVFVMAGLPGQTLAVAQETAGFVRALYPDSLSVKAFKHYPECATSPAPEPSPEETAAQIEILTGAREVIAMRPVRRLSRWQRALLRTWLRGWLRLKGGRG